MGQLNRTDDLTYTLQAERAEYSLITLEPAVERCLQDHPCSTPLRLLAVENPWGGWWRVLRVLDQSN